MELRTHNCGELRQSDEGKHVKLCGWLSSVRDLGAVIFFVLRDYYGYTQAVVTDEDKKEQIRAIPRESTISIEGKVVLRSAPNKEMPTGMIEIEPEKIELLGKCYELLPFEIATSTQSREDVRLKYRFLDLRNPDVKAKIVFRSKVVSWLRNKMTSLGFLEITTPILTSSSPEGARDYIVPSRLYPGHFYALPQAPQQYKQLLMASGFDKYFQIAPCFRDEDARADRSPGEFYQLDTEMCFATQEDVFTVMEDVLSGVFKEFSPEGYKVDQGPFRRITYRDAMRDYGSDKPDLRFGMEFADLTDLAQGHGFAVFDDAEYVTGFAATGCAGYTRKQIDALTEFVKRQQIGAKGLVWIRVEADGNVKSSVDKFYSPEQVRAMAERAGAKAGDLVLILCGKKFKTLTQLCALRLEVAQQLGLRDPKKFAPLWVIDFPLFEWDDETQRYYAVHHPFTSPKLEDVQYLDSDPGRVRANAYDFVCNGTEIGGGSIRIHDSKLQAKMFELLGFTAEQAQERFGFLMNAFKYGAPPHGGLAFGFDRLCSLFGGSESIRDYIAFPKNNNGRDMMLDAPGYIDQAQLDELHIQLVKPEE